MRLTQPGIQYCKIITNMLYLFNLYQIATNDG